MSLEAAISALTGMNFIPAGIFENPWLRISFLFLKGSKPFSLNDELSSIRFLNASVPLLP